MKFIQPAISAICTMAGFFTLYLAARSISILLSGAVEPSASISFAILVSASLSGLSFAGAYKAPSIVERSLGHSQ